MPHVYQGYWEDIGTIRSFFEANLDLVTNCREFNFFDMSAPDFHPAAVPAGSQDQRRRTSSTPSFPTAASSIDAQIDHSIVGIRSLIDAGCELNRIILLGCDYYESRGVHRRQTRSEGLPRIGIGKNTQHRERHHRQERAHRRQRASSPPQGKPENVDHPLYFIRDGIVIIPKNGDHPARDGHLMNDSGEYSITALLELAVSARAGTLRCRTGEPPELVVEGEEQTVQGPPVTAENAGAMLLLLAGARRMRELWKNGAIEFEHDFRKLARFKVRASQAGEDIEFDLNMMG